MEQGARVAALPDNHHRFVCGAHLLVARGSGRTARSLTTTLPATLRSTAVLLIFLSFAVVSALPTKRRLDDVVLTQLVELCK